MSVCHGVNMSLSRRQFIKASGVALCAGAAPLKAHLRHHAADD
ncbi:Putative cell division protein precursor [Klebsiella pneumoniae IS43]|uniref:Cell division protein n=1 Tax=Klebsiella pneumoniae IS43 TaxID=1432552 RepID=W1DE06_KLEPN|nr:Putative cell division protein precursor [Klebsiella pneumoniae IS43]